MKIEIAPGDELVVVLEGTDGEFRIAFDKDGNKKLQVFADLPDDRGRGGDVDMNDLRKPQKPIRVRDDLEIRTIAPEDVHRGRGIALAYSSSSGGAGIYLTEQDAANLAAALVRMSPCYPEIYCEDFSQTPGVKLGLEENPKADDDDDPSVCFDPAPSDVNPSEAHAQYKELLRSQSQHRATCPVCCDTRPPCQGANKIQDLIAGMEAEWPHLKDGP